MSSEKTYTGQTYFKQSDKNVLLAGCTINVYKTAPSPVNPNPAVLLKVQSDEKGTFNIDFTQDTFAGLKMVYLTIQSPKGKTLKLAYPVNIETTDYSKVYSFYIEAEFRYSQRTGTIFFVSVIVGLCILAAVYLILHNKSSLNEPNSTISTLIDYSLENMPADSLLSTSEIVRSLADTLSGEIKTLLSAGRIDSVKASAADLILNSAKEYANAKNGELYRISIEQTRRELDFYETSYLWQTKPYIYLEIFFWALFATFLRLIVSTGYYLYIRRFLTSTIYYKVGLMFMVPIIAIVISVILSYVNVEVTLGDTGFKSGFENPETVIIIATLIGLTPWGSWEFLEDLADRFGKMLSNISGDKKQADPQGDDAT